MSRTSLRKAAYFGIVGGGVIVGVWAVRHFQPNAAQVFGVILLCFIPGRILGFFWRDLLRGLRLLKAHQYEESIQYSEAFLYQLKLRPWIRHLIWLGTGTCSRDAEALALNNLGAAEVALGRWEAARLHLNASLSKDSENPLLYHNLSRLAKAEGRLPEAERFAGEAKKRGLTFGFIDQIIMSSQDRLSKSVGVRKKS